MVIGLGVERWDFTKGIIERFQALEALLERNPQHRGRITLLQIASPSRSQLPAYQALQEQTYREVERINAKFGEADWRPIVLIDEHQEPRSVFELYRAADFCLVNSLHDGMNLVAKEFVAARDDEDGVLILSTFAGASRELTEAVLINPFDVNETAEAMEIAMRMGRNERRDRMSLMRRTVKENNVYRWAGRMLMDAARIRQRQNLPSAEAALRRRRRRSTPRGEGAQAFGGGLQRLVALGDAQAQQRHRGGLRVEGRQRDGGDFRLANQPVRKIDIARMAESSVVDQKEIRARRRHRLEARAAQQPRQQVALGLEERR